MSESTISHTDASGMTIAKAKKGLDEMANSAARNTAAATDAIKDSYEAARRVVGRGTEAAKNAKVYVKAHPWVALGICVAIGFLIGAMSRRR